MAHFRVTTELFNYYQLIRLTTGQEFGPHPPISILYLNNDRRSLVAIVIGFLLPTHARNIFEFILNSVGTYI
jgi:hypothetical protein